MKVPLEITFRGVSHSQALEDLIREKSQKMDQFSDRITRCRVAIEKKQEHQRRGNPYRVRLDISIPRHEIVIKREPSKGQLHDPLSTVIRNAFKTAYRQIREVVDRQRDHVLPQPTAERDGVIERIKKSAGYGFLRTGDGQDVYFHRNSVMNDDFDNLLAGDDVHFVEEAGLKGPQAAVVYLTGRKNI